MAKRVAKKSLPKKVTATKAKQPTKAKSKPAAKPKAAASKGKAKKVGATNAIKKSAPMPAPETQAEPLVGGPAQTPAAQPLKPPPAPKPKSPAAAPGIAQAQPKLDKSSAHQRNLKAATMKGRIAKSAAGPNIAGHISARGRRAQARRDSKN